MKKFFALFVCLLFALSVGISCKSSGNTDKVEGSKATSTKTTKSNATSSGKAESAEPVSEGVQKARENTAKQRGEQATSVMMKRATALANTYCNCANSKNVEGCRKRMQGSYDATVKRLPEDKKAEFKASYEGQIASCN